MPEFREKGEKIPLSEKNDLLFYSAYEDFYAMARDSHAFAAFCRDAFGADFSQDGFSDRWQVDLILEHIPAGAAILDIGCGAGKMLGYLQEKTGAHISGFDYSGHAIETAKRLFPYRSEFREGLIGEIEYPPETFDVIISMDTMYFAPDMSPFTAQVKSWLKPGGVFFVGYQEGDVIPKTPEGERTLLEKALEANGMAFTKTDITRQTYDMLRRKRRAARAHKREFYAEGNQRWFGLLMMQTLYALRPYGRFRKKMARYIYVAKK